MSVGHLEFEDLGSVAALRENYDEKKVIHERPMQILDIHSRDLTLMLERLVQRGYLERKGSGRGCYYELSIETNKSNGQLVLEAEKGPQTSSQNKTTSSPNSDTNSPNKPSKVPEDSSGSVQSSESREKLLEIAQPIRETQRVSDRQKMKDVIVRLCSVRSLSHRELADLLDRNSDGLRDQYLSELVEAGRLKLQHPGRISHPDQSYIANK